jgi:hypothetical protein
LPSARRCSPGNTAASIASRATRRDDRDTPLLSSAGRRCYTLIYISEKEKYFCEEGLTGIPKTCPDGQINCLSRRDFARPVKAIGAL